MSLHVASQLARLGAGIRTERAAVRPLAGVRAPMNRQVAAVAEHLAAELAGPRAPQQRRRRRRDVVTVRRRQSLVPAVVRRRRPFDVSRGVERNAAQSAGRLERRRRGGGQTVVVVRVALVVGRSVFQATGARRCNVPAFIRNRYTVIDAVLD